MASRHYLYPPGGNPTPTDTIATNTTWGESNQYIAGGIEIKSGATLTINTDTVFMPKGGVISVEAGGHLVCNSCVITNGCSQCFWQGIELKGHGTDTMQTTANDGWATLTNGTIANAVVGVTNYGGSGGVVQATGTSFVDCNNDVTLRNFTYYISSSVPGANRSYFIECNFVLDSNYKGDQMIYPASYFVTLESVEGVNFEGCNWLNRDRSTEEAGRGTGIYAVDGGFGVGVYCPPLTGCTTPTPSRFCGFTNAIQLSGTGIAGSGYTTSIDKTIFDSCSVGINIAALNEVSMTEDTFNVGWGIPLNNISEICVDNIGIYTQKASMYRIEGNYFKGKPTITYLSSVHVKNIGTVVGNTDIGEPSTHVPYNDVYRNTFYHLTHGVYALGANKGLNVSCNEFLDDTDDIFIIGDGGSLWQGVSSIGSLISPAGNTFSGSTVNVVDSTNPVVYYYQTGYISVHPTHAGPVYTYSTSATTSCTSTYVAGGGGAGLPPIALVRIDQSTLRAYEITYIVSKGMMYDSIRSEYSLIDLGNHDSLINYIDTVSDTGALYKTLTAGSPYLSGMAVEAVAGITMLNDTLMESVLELNPDLLRNPSLWEFVDSIYSFPSCMVRTLHHYAQDSMTTRTVTEDSIQSYKMTMANAEHIIMLDINAPGDTSVSVTDTTGEGICTDSTSMYYTLDSNSAYSNSGIVDTCLRTIGGLWADYARVGYYNAQQQYDIADSIYFTIPSYWLAIDSMNSLIYSPGSKDYTPPAVAGMSNIWDVLYNAETSGRNIYDLDSSDITSLDTSSAPLAPANTAEILTNTLTNIINPSISSGSILVIPCLEVIPTDRNNHKGHGGDGPQSQMAGAMPLMPNMVQAAGGQQFSVFPNPTSGMVTFNYNVPDAGGDVKIEITNVVGEQEAEIHTGNNTGAVQWNANLLSPGIYIYQASGANGIICTGKLVLAK